MSRHTITLPLPPRCLSPNARPHWAAKMNAAKKYRATAFLHGRRIRNRERWDAATVQLHWFSKTKRRPDADNALASMKNAFDGLVDAGIIADDENLTHLPIVWGVDKERPRVEVVIQRSAVAKEQV